MLNLKKIAAIVMLIFGGNTVFAGTMGPICSGVGATTECEGTAWDFGARALYVKPIHSSGDYSYSAIDNPTGAYQNYRKSSAWGFFLEGSYHYSTGSDVNLNWYNISHSENQNYLGDFNYLSDLAIDEGHSHLYPTWNAVNLELGQSVGFGENKNVRFHAGFQYARIVIPKELRGTTPLVHDDFFVFNDQARSNYNGFGARIGADMKYALGYGLGIYANTAAALLTGGSKISNAYLDSLGRTLQTSASKVMIIPELDAKLGVRYDYAMALGDLSVDIGWIWFNYFNVTQAIQSNFIAATTPQVVTGDFGFEGLSFGLHWLGNGL